MNSMASDNTGSNMQKLDLATCNACDFVVMHAVFNLATSSF